MEKYSKHETKLNLLLESRVNFTKLRKSKTKLLSLSKSRVKFYRNKANLRNEVKISKCLMLRINRENFPNFTRKTSFEIEKNFINRFE